jgi:predicted XRE-type DNA-binding protein
MVWTLTNGAIPEDQQVLHRCDNRRCCNPSHLFLGTNADNVADRGAKNRSAPMAGQLNPRAKITPSDVAAIRGLYAAGLTQREIAARFGINQQSVSNVVTGVRWNHT